MHWKVTIIFTDTVQWRTMNVCLRRINFLVVFNWCIYLYEILRFTLSCIKVRLNELLNPNSIDFDCLIEFDINSKKNCLCFCIALGNARFSFSVDVLFVGTINTQEAMFLIRPRSQNSMSRPHSVHCVCVFIYVCMYRDYFPSEFNTYYFCFAFQDVHVLLPKLAVGESKNSRNVE